MSSASPLVRSARTIYLCGRSRYELNDSFFAMPEGTRVSFFGHYLRSFPHGLVKKILGGSLLGPERTIGEFESCPDLNLYEDDDSYLKETAEALARNPAGGVIVSVNGIKSRLAAGSREEIGTGRHFVKLSKICAEFPGSEIVWLASTGADFESIEYRELPVAFYALAGGSRDECLHGSDAREAAQEHAVRESRGEAEETLPRIEDGRVDRIEGFATAISAERPGHCEAGRATKSERYERMIANAVKAARHRLASADDRTRTEGRSLEAREAVCG